MTPPQSARGMSMPLNGAAIECSQSRCPEITLVCPYVEALLPRIPESRVVWMIENLSDLQSVYDRSIDHGIEIRCVRFRFDGDFCDLDVEGVDTFDLPLAIEVRGLGRLARCRRHFDWLAANNARLYLPLRTAEQANDLRILSSLGFASCAVLPSAQETEVDWDAISDLAVYVLYSAGSHADIDPFSYLKNTYDGRTGADFSKVYFDDPASYLQVDEAGRLAWRRRDLLAGDFIDCQLEDHRSILGSLEHRAAITASRLAFLQPNACARCEAWRVCQGKFDGEAHYPKCRDAFYEVMQCTERSVHTQPQRKTLWRHY